MFSYIKSLFVSSECVEDCECADAIGFHAIYDERYHNVRPTTLGSSATEDRSVMRAWASYTREHVVEC